MNKFTKDHIKDRLLRRAAKNWGFSDVELENTFDPIVNLLFDVCAKELEKIANDIYSSRRRITERLIDILTPNVSSKAVAARGILTAYPTEDEQLLNDMHQFYYQKKEINPYNPTETIFSNFYFGPTNNLKLSRNKIEYVVLPNATSTLYNNQFREFVSGKNYIKPLPHSTIYFAIKHEGNNVIQDLMFYFFQKNSEQKNTFFHFLPSSKWYFNGERLEVKRGYNNEKTNTYKDENERLHSNFYHLRKYEEHVNDFYENNFLTITSKIELDKKSYQFPEELNEVFTQEVLDQFKTEKLVWLKVEFPNVIGPNYLSEIFCALNCFPIINKKYNEIQGKVKEVMNIYPLQLNNDFFLELMSVQDNNLGQLEILDTNDEYSENNFAHLRFGGISRFDERAAIDEINYLIDLIRDEASAFSRLGNDFTNTNLKEINQIIKRFKNKISELTVKNADNPYLILNTKNNDLKGNVFVKYWTTIGEEANKINMFSKFILQRGTDFEKESMNLLSSTLGGKNELSNSEKIYAYRENLISNQRVVTRQDIIILCKNHYGDSINKVEVKNGIQTSLDKNIGYTPTIDVFIDKTDENIFNSEEWEFLKDDLKLKIENRAVNVVPFRIIYS